MSIKKHILQGSILSVLFSVITHTVIAASLYWGWAKTNEKPIIAELDLSMSTLVSMPENKGGGSGNKTSAVWNIPKKAKLILPQEVPSTTETKEEVTKNDENDIPCIEPCNHSSEKIGQGWGGGSGEGDGVYVPASQTAKQPRWIKKFITSQDYPRIAKQEGKDGKILLLVLIDDIGQVKDARLLQGSYETLNETALRKVKQAVFSPAYDANGKPVSCKVTLPIRFELR